MKWFHFKIFAALLFLSSVVFAQSAPFPNPDGRPGDCATLSGPTGMLKKMTKTFEATNYNTCFSWDNRGNMQGRVGSNGFLTDFTYDLLGRITLNRDVMGDERTPTYNVKQQIQQLQEPLHNSMEPAAPPNKVTQFGYDIIGNVLTSQVVGGDLWRNHYDADFQAKANVGPDGHLAAIQTFQSLGRLGTVGVAEVDGQGNIINESLGRTKLSYNEGGQLDGIINGVGSQWTITPDPLGRIKQNRAPDGTTVAFGYDDGNRLVWQEIRNAAGVMQERTDWAYDILNRLTQMQHTKAGDANVWKTDWFYNNFGMTEVESSSLNNQLYFTKTRNYDHFHRPITLTLPSTGSWNYTYNPAGQLQNISHSALGQEKFFEYDPAGRIKSVRDGFNNTTNYSYDSQGNVVKIVPPVGDPEIFYYDLNGRMKQKLTGLWSMQFLYDGAGRYQKWMNSAMSGTRYDYKLDTGLIQAAVLPTNAQYTVTQRDLDGRLTRWTDPNGTEFFIYYDVNGRPSQLQISIGPSVSYRAWKYDESGHLLAIGESMTQPPSQFSQFVNGPTNPPPPYDPNLISVVRFTYNALGYPIVENEWVAGVWYTTTTSFAAGGSGIQSSTTYPSGLRADRTTDLAGKVITLRGVWNNQSIVIADYNYEKQPNFPDSPRLNSVELQNQIIRGNFIYDANQRVMQHQVLKNGVETGKIRYKYSPRGEWIARSDHFYPVAQNLISYNVTQGVNELRNPVWWSLIDDATFDQIANNTSSFEGPLAVQRYFYNTAQHRTIQSTKDPNAGLAGIATNGTSLEHTIRADNVSQSSVMRACRYNASGQQEWCDPNIPDVNFTFDPDSNGNLRSNKVVGAAGPTHTFDLLGRLISVTNPMQNKTITYQYDGLKRLIRRKVVQNGNVIMENHFAWEGDRLVESRRVAGGNQTLNYVYGRNENDLVARTDTFNTNYYMQYGDGSVAMLMDSQGTVLEWYRYNPFGDTRAWKFNMGQVLSVPLSSTATTQLYKGQYYDSLTGYYFLNGEWYDPVNGQSLNAQGVQL